MDKIKQTGIILLAAGASARLGFPKQLISFQGETLLSYMCKIALASKADEVLVVLGAHSDALSETFMDIPVHLSYNQEWKLGIGSSIKHGLRALLNRFPDMSAVIIMLCDQPHVDVNLLNNLIQTHLETFKPVVACQYGDVIGVPALYHHSYFNYLNALSDESGAHALLASLDEEKRSLIAFEKGIIDIDTEEDILKYLYKI